MSSNYFLTFLIAIFILQTAGRTAIVLSASWYDFKQPKFKPRRNRASQPALTVLVLVDNHQASLEACLDRLLHSRYKKLQVSVVNNGSHDASAAILRRYAKAYPERLLVTTKRRAVPARVAYAAAYKKIQPAAAAHRQSVIMTLRGDQLMQGNISTFMTQFKSKMQAIVRLRVQPIMTPSLFALQANFDSLIIDHTHKAALAAPMLVRDDWLWWSALACNEVVFKEMLANRTTQFIEPSVYLSSGILRTLPVTTLRRLIVAWRTEQVALLPLSRIYGAGRIVSSLQAVVTIAEPVMIGYFFYLAYTGRTTALFLLSCGGFILWTWQTITANDQLSMQCKLHFMAVTPIMYVLYFFKTTATATLAIGRLLPVK